MIESFLPPGLLPPPMPAAEPPAAESRGTVIAAGDARALVEVLRPDISLAIWQRDMPKPFARGLKPLLAATPFCVAAEDTPDAAVAAVAADLAVGVPMAFWLDVLGLAELFAALIGQERIALRLEGITGPGCHRWHADAVGLRLLTTYRGPGTEWLALPGGARTAMGLDPAALPATPRRLATGDVAVFKGEGYPGNAGWGAIHRSPPAGPGAQARLLLCLDEPGRIPLA